MAKDNPIKIRMEPKAENHYTVTLTNGTYYIMVRTVENGTATLWKTYFDTVNLWGMLSTSNELHSKGYKLIA